MFNSYFSLLQTETGLFQQSDSGSIRHKTKAERREQINEGEERRLTGCRIEVTNCFAFWEATCLLNFTAPQRVVLKTNATSAGSRKKLQRFQSNICFCPALEYRLNEVADTNNQPAASFGKRNSWTSDLIQTTLLDVLLQSKIPSGQFQFKSGAIFNG